MRGRNRWTAVAVVAGALLVVSVIPVPGAVPEEGGGIPTSVLFHFLGYGTLTATLGLTVLDRSDRVQAAVTAPSGSSAYGALMECLQYPIPYRSFSYFDMLVNAAGAMLGAVALFCALVLSASDEHR
ncbi:VanZ family protein [Halalkalicoccus sp. NIPERK01]|uniref:VanZ family protein n=1 Tax=Halalkalicoccus sp. NIPERK01 TaxID=3053469 RepID=UPI00256E9C7B|nr:VanZ family protein [Halalkalicoccus sp. NIPERK01]MDL5361155.1 VanZ family protein [Halalkalicoccus sp. NIPERK01]